MRDAKNVDYLANFGGWIAFSPDGKWFLTGSPPSKIWSTSTWAIARQLGGTGLCFSHDSRLVAVLDANKITNLVEAETGRVIARLESPEPSTLLWAAFSPDDSRLVLVPMGAKAVHVWDLRAIRNRLALMRLDWYAPPFRTMTRRPGPLLPCRQLQSTVARPPP